MISFSLLYFLLWQTCFILTSYWGKELVPCIFFYCVCTKASRFKLLTLTDCYFFTFRIFWIKGSRITVYIMLYVFISFQLLDNIGIKIMIIIIPGIPEHHHWQQPHKQFFRSCSPSECQSNKPETWVSIHFILCQLIIFHCILTFYSNGIFSFYTFRFS